MTTDSLSATFAALADPTRRAILARLATGQCPVTELAAPFDMSLPAISKHLGVLEHAGLISRGREAQWRPCRIEATPIKDVVGLGRAVSRNLGTAPRSSRHVSAADSTRTSTASGASGPRPSTGSGRSEHVDRRESARWGGAHQKIKGESPWPSAASQIAAVYGDHPVGPRDPDDAALRRAARVGLRGDDEARARQGMVGPSRRRVLRAGVRD